MKLVDERKKRNLSQLQAANKIGISQSMLAMMENEQRSGSDEIKTKIANYYGLSVGYLFFDEKITKRDNIEKEVTA